MSGKSKRELASGFNSRAIHAGWEPDEHMGSINVPIYASTTFEQNGLADLRGGFEYGRVANPTVRSLEHTLAALEDAQYARQRIGHLHLRMFKITYNLLEIRQSFLSLPL